MKPKVVKLDPWETNVMSDSRTVSDSRSHCHMTIVCIHIIQLVLHIIGVHKF